MKGVFFAVAAAFLSQSVLAYVDLGPAYRIRIQGSEDWELINKIEKEPVFVEGLEMIDDNNLLESAGGYWGSKIQRLSLSHKKAKAPVQVAKDLPSGNFGEGCTLFNNKVYQMTYREGNVFVFDKDNLESMHTLKMPKQMEEGWGLTHDATHLWASDGTNRLFKIKPDNFEVEEIIEVKDVHGKAIHYINELELVGDHIYGNVLPLNIIIKVNKNTGTIEKIYDMKKLYEIQSNYLETNRIGNWDHMNNVFNGIAYRKATNTFLVTGKNYNFIFEVKLQ